MSNKMLVVYNTCSIGTEPNVRDWDKKIKPLINQTLDGLKICQSDCGSEDKYLSKIRETYGNSMSYYYIKLSLPIHITFNACIRKCVERYGEFEWYVYLSSGTTFKNDDMLEKIYNYLQIDDKIGRVLIPAENDNSAPTDFMTHALELKMTGRYKGKGHRITQTPKMQMWDKSKKYVLKPGQRLTNHASIISNEWFKKFNNKLHPDIYNGIGVEGNYSYLASSIHKQNIIIPTNILRKYVPNDEVDGTSDKHNLPIQKKRSEWMFREFRDLEKINLKNQHLGFVTDLPFRYRLEPKVEYKGRIVSNYEPDVAKIYEGLFDEEGFYLDKSNENLLYENLRRDLFLSDKEFNYKDFNYEMWE